MAKRDFTITVTDKTLAWKFVANGKTALEFDASKVHESLLERVFVYGCKQIIADGGALDKDATLDEKVAMMEKRANSLRDGTWGTRVASTPTISDAAAMEVIARKFGMTVEQVAAMLAAKTEE